MQPNNGNQVQSNKNNFFGIRVSNPGINVSNATDSQLQYLNNYNQEIFFANGFANVLIGQRPPNTLNGLSSPEEGFFVAEPGIDVRQATDQQMIFNSQQDTFKIVSSPTVAVVVDDPLPSGGSTVVATPHGLNVVPAFLGFINGSGSSYLTPGTFYQTPYYDYVLVTGIPEPIAYTLTADSTNIYATVANKGGVGITDIGTVVFKYYILAETAGSV